MLKCLLNNEIGNYLEECCRGLAEELFLHLQEGTREYDEKSSGVAAEILTEHFGVNATGSCTVTILS
jgi:hypothetical protein